MEQVNYAISYPELSKEGQDRTQAIINKFSTQLNDLMNDTVSSFTRNLSEEIVDDDSWIDIRQKTLEAMAGYHDSEKKADGTYLGQWWVQIRRKILEENREQITSDIISDKEAEIKRLKEEIEYMQKNRF